MNTSFSGSTFHWRITMRVTMSEADPIRLTAIRFPLSSSGLEIFFRTTKMCSRRLMITLMALTSATPETERLSMAGRSESEILTLPPAIA